MWCLLASHTNSNVTIFIIIIILSRKVLDWRRCISGARMSEIIMNYNQENGNERRYFILLFASTNVSFDSHLL
jgi:hypothetical protein